MTPEPLQGIKWNLGPSNIFFRKIYRSKPRSKVAYANAETKHFETRSEKFYGILKLFSFLG